MHLYWLALIFITFCTYSLKILKHHRLVKEMAKERKSSLNYNKIENYTHFMILPLKIVACWDWFPKTNQERHFIINNVYLGMVLLILVNMPLMLIVNLYTEWTNIMENLEKIADGLPLLVSVFIVAYFAKHKEELYELTDYMNKNFKFYSARGLTNVTMYESYKAARNFGYLYTACTLFSVTMYCLMPVFAYLWTKQPLDTWPYMDITSAPFYVLAFLRMAAGQGLIGLAVGQLGVFFASNSILLCGQLDLLCCSLRNVRYTALLQRGVRHRALAERHSTIKEDELHHYSYTSSRLQESKWHYNAPVINNIIDVKTYYDIYSSEYEEATIGALRDCARVSQVINTYKKMFERFVSPLLVLRVVQVTMYLCTLLYAATLRFDMVTVEYLVAVALDIFVYCYFGNQIILQADRISTAAYQSHWPSMGLRARRQLLNILLANKRPVIVRAGNFLPMDLHTFIVIIKTSFSYYTLLVNVNEKKKS